MNYLSKNVREIQFQHSGYEVCSGNFCIKKILYVIYILYTYHVSIYIYYILFCILKPMNINDICNVSNMPDFILYADYTNDFNKHENIYSMCKIVSVELDKLCTCLKQISIIYF